jgi:phosphate uptake regulator
MSENVLNTLQRLIQDVIAPDVRELKVRVAALEKSMDQRFDGVAQRFNGVSQRFDGVSQRFDAVDERFHSLERSIDERFSSLERQSEAQFQALLAAIGESRAQAELSNTRGLAALSERVAVLEARQH